MNVIPYNKLKYGEDNINLAADGSTYINKAYVGSALSLVRFSEYPRLKITATSLDFKTAGGSEDIGVVSNASWSASTSSSWLTIVTAATGFTVTASENDTEIDRDGVITVTAWNIDATITSSITVSQPYVLVTYLAYIYRSGTVADVSTYSITTPIYPAVDCEMRIKYQARGTSCDRIVGVTHADRTDHSDSKDFRLFNFSNGSLDLNNLRTSNLGLVYTNGTTYDLTIGNYFVYNNATSSYMMNGTTQGDMLASDTLIHVDVGAIKVQSLEIKNGGVVVFDGQAAYDPNTQKYGLYDSVTQTLYTNDDIVMTGDELT